MSKIEDIKVGDTISIPTYAYESRWWIRLWYWVTFRDCPRREMVFRVVHEVKL